MTALFIFPLSSSMHSHRQADPQYRFQEIFSLGGLTAQQQIPGLSGKPAGVLMLGVWLFSILYGVRHPLPWGGLLYSPYVNRIGVLAAGRSTARGEEGTHQGGTFVGEDSAYDLCAGMEWGAGGDGGVAALGVGRSVDYSPYL